MTKKKKQTQEQKLARARATGRNAVNRMKEYKKGIQDGLALSREARRD